MPVWDATCQKEPFHDYKLPRQAYDVCRPRYAVAQSRLDAAALVDENFMSAPIRE